jgi:hypothetical protein
MGKSEFVTAIDAIQAAIKPMLKSRGYKSRGRTFNRLTEDGLTQVVNIQMAPSDPPGTTYIPGLRENMHGLFTLNLGVYVPEVAAVHGGGIAKSWVQEYRCCIRDRFVDPENQSQGIWWHARASSDVIEDITSCLLSTGLPFVDRFSTRDLILAELQSKTENLSYCMVPRIVCAIILAERGKVGEARNLLAEQALETRNPGHPEYVRGLAERMGLGAL